MTKLMAHETGVATYRIVLYILALLVGGLGILLVLGSLPGTGTFDWRGDYTGAGVVLVASALAAAVAISSATSFREQRAYDSARDRDQARTDAERDRSQRELAAERDLDQRRHEASLNREQREADLRLAWRADQAKVYEQLITLVIRSFTGGTPRIKEAGIRGQVAVWGSQDLVNATGEWMRFASQVTKAGGSTTPGQRDDAYRLIGDIVVAARKDLGEHQSAIPDTDSIMKMLFNDYESPARPSFKAADDASAQNPLRSDS